MGKEAWNTIKKSKRFNVTVYRHLQSLLILSLAVNILLALACYYYYFSWPEREFFASNGVTQPVKLVPRLSPNTSSNYLLASQQATEGQVSKNKIEANP